MRRQWSSYSRLWTFAAVAASILGVAAAGRAAPQRPTPAVLQRLQSAVQQLQQAEQVRNVTPGKEASNRLQAALDAYNAARDAAYGPQLGTNSASGSFDGTIPEVEANNTAATAQSLNAVLAQEGSAVVAGEIRAAGDLDYFSFTVAAGSRVWAYVDTGGVQTAGAASRDSVLTLFNTDQTTLIEADDDDGTGNGRDAATESTQSSVIAGTLLPGAGTYYLRLHEFNNDQILAPYRLYVVITTASGVNEAEPNGTTATANTLLPVGAAVGIVNGSATGADLDVYRLALQAGDVATLQLDEDPTRDTVPSRDTVTLLDPTGAALLAVTHGGSLSGVFAGEGFSFRAVTSGVYFVVVQQQAAATDTDYTLLACVHTRSVGAVSVINGVLGSGSVDYPAISGTQVGRIFRNSIPSDCEAAPKPFPGTTDGTNPHPFDAYLFKNRSGKDACVAVSLTAYDAAPIHGCIYGTFDPGNLEPGYLGDCGSSTLNGTPVSFSVKVAPGAVFVVVLSDVSLTAVGKPYMLTVTGDIRSSLVGCPANISISNDPNLAGAVVNYNAPGVTDPSLGPVVCAPASGSFFPIGDTLVTCRDQAGTTCSFTVTVKDTQPPTAICPGPITANLDQPGGAVVNYMAGVSDNAPGASVVCTPDSGSVFPLGLTVVTCTATDAAGNTSTCTFPVTVRDTEAPVITCPTSVTVNQTQANGAQVTYSASATDNSGTVSFTSSPSSGTVFPLGATIVTCTASDAGGNTTVRTFIVTVKDTQAPSITCPASVSAVQDEAGGALVSYNVTTSDNAGSVNLSCSPASGSFFAVGTTTVTCVAVDTSGNVSTCTFPVTVTAPNSTAGAKASGSGTLANGSPAAKFKINASVAATGLPKLTFTHTQTGQALKSTSVSAIVKSGNLVKIFGKLRNGTGPEQAFLLEVRDVAKPGATKDTYRLEVRGGFQQPQTVIATGEITVK